MYFDGSEYFVRGNEPVQTYVMHQPGSDTQHPATFEGLRPPPQGSVPLPEQPPVAVASPEPSQPNAAIVSADQEPKKKRGFWSKLFGREKKDEGEDKDKSAKPEPR